ncbi:keratin, type I cytoskeletal 23 [Tachyglossus aculeatus]|uniref:keratin, type I cytoskeletal 23 n=1 Tax=Tachyglossus aculeatus TaxID=9261 RepID=UPI0018F37E23|nr:keratin, type I cytoskeletal 23 [Tachyglossus aculeatus]
MTSSYGSFQAPSACGWARPGKIWRAPSVHGGAGGIRISVSSARPFCGTSWERGYGGGFGWGGEKRGLLGGNGKETMQNLNKRLAAYLETVRSLEAANTKLESRILEWHKKRDPDKKLNYTPYEENISSLQEQIMDGKLTNAKIILQIDNARMAVDDFGFKYENELFFTKDMEVEVEALRKILDGLTITTTDLEMEVEGMREELILMKKKHEQEIETHSMPNDFKVNVKVNATAGEDLVKILEDMRKEYEVIITKRSKDLDTWYKEKSASVSQGTGIEVVTTNKSDINELRRTFQALEIDLQAQRSTKSALEAMLAETKCRNSCQLQNMQQVISHYETQLAQLRHDLERQNNEYKILLGIKTHLEKEIATYHQLMEGEDNGGMDDSKSTRKESTKSAAPKIKAIMQDSVNGRVVLSQESEIQ